GQGGRVSVINADGTGLRQVSSANALYTPPAWSPDGTEIVFQTFDYVLHIVDADGSNERVVSADDYSDSPTWCPDGTLYFAAQPEPESGVGVYALNEDGTRSFVTRGTPSDCAPSGQLTFVRDGDVHIIDPSEAGTPNLTNSENRSDSHPRWSPGGEMIAFVSTPDLPDPLVVERTVGLSLRKHLVAWGRLLADSNACVTGMIRGGVKIQKLAENGWRTLRKIQPDSEGRFRVDLKDRRGFYRAVAPHTYSEFGEAECLRAVSNLERHRH
ncbi:MAG: TolB family protein, partial [Actinomycetota bacterium]